MATVHLIRHGQTAWTATDRVQGWAPVPLSARGEAQAAALGEHLHETTDLDRLVTSDLRRCAETAAFVVDAHDGLPLVEDRVWRERDFGVYQGLSDETFFGDFPEFSVADNGEAALDARPEKGESWTDVYERVETAWGDLLAGLGDDETLGLVTHTGPLLVVHGLLRDLAPLEALGQSHDECGVSTVAVEDGRARLVDQNDTSFLTGVVDRT